METSEIQKAKSVQSVKKKEAISAPAKVEDTVSVSSDAQKIENWVGMLNEMPDIRSEMVDAVLSRELPSDASAVIAQKLLESSV